MPAFTWAWTPMWTDCFFYLLVLILCSMAGLAYRQPYWHQYCRTVLTHRAGRWGARILFVYLCIGLLDSIHFTITPRFPTHPASHTTASTNTASQPSRLSAFSGDAFSLLDWCLFPLGQYDERSYSRPFAKYGLTPITIETPEGYTRRVPVKLQGHYHIFGTDKVGQDVFYQSIKSIRTALIIGGLTLLIMLPLAISLGLCAGYFGGKIDYIMQYIAVTLSAVPTVLFISATVLAMQVFIDRHSAAFPTALARADIQLLALCGILGITSFSPLYRLLRGEALKLRALPFVSAARHLGKSHTYILLKHLLPNTVPLILITAVLDFSQLILAEAVLSYVGVGVDPSLFSWGNMINGARLELARDPAVWWPLTAAFLLMFTLVLGANLFAEALRDAGDPRYQ